MSMFPSFSQYKFIETDGGTLVKAGPTFLKTVFVGAKNASLSNAYVTLFDGLDATGTTILKFSATSFTQPWSVDLADGIQLQKGLYVFQQSSILASPLTIVYY